MAPPLFQNEGQKRAQADSISRTVETGAVAASSPKRQVRSSVLLPALEEMMNRCGEAPADSFFGGLWTTTPLPVSAT